MSNEYDESITVSNVENFFWLNSSRDNNYFDESPVTRVAKALYNTSSIDTSAIDGYRQGVEIQVMKHFDAGTIKIHAGEPGHFVKQNTFGLNNVYNSTKSFNDIGGIDPVQFIGATTSENRRVTAQPFISAPPPELDSLSFDRFLYDGVLDFLGARRRRIFLCTDSPVETTGVVGEIQDGNLDENRATSKIVSISEFNVLLNQRPFTDAPELLDRRWPTGDRVVLTNAVCSAFDDTKLLRNAAASSLTYDDAMISALSLMSGSTDNFISIKQRSSTSGWDYDSNIAIGTDSIAFGGMTY